MATVGTWVAIIIDPEWGGKFEVGTVIETQVGFDNAPPRCKLDDDGIIKRYFVPGAQVELIPKLHKLPVDAAPVLTRAGAVALATESPKYRAISDARAAAKAAADAEIAATKAEGK
jgi:hypothetical protein